MLKLNLSFRTKFFISSLFASLIVPLFCGWILYKNDIKNTAELIKTNFESQIINFSNLIYPALVFDDVETCFEQLEGFSTNPLVRNSVVWKKSEGNQNKLELFTSYPKNNQQEFPLLEKSQIKFDNNILTISKPILANNESIGIISVTRSLDDLFKKKTQYLQIGVTSILLISIILILIILWYQNSLTKPLKELNLAATTISKGKNYLVRAKKISFDEFGKLTDVFNEMLDSLEESSEQLKLANEEMEQRVQRRTKELTLSNKRISEEMEQKELANIELIKTRQQLVQHEKLANVGQVSSSIAHELRNPMAAIRNSTYFLRLKLEKNQKLSKHLHIIDKEITRSDEVIQRLLQITKGENLKKTTADLKEIAEEAFNYANLEEKATLHIDYETKPFAVKLDKLLIRQVFYNLFLNSIQAMSGSGKVYLRIKKEPNNHASISIKDEGIGISENDLGKIFNPLFTNKKNGIGLGLSICKDLILRHQGSIDVKSSPNIGTTFFIKIPVR
ncbi:MAG: hypothetical protein CMI23_08520 [Opitutae bacterium]|nr:hypothetical protein [Opitutae bacterium]